MYVTCKKFLSQRIPQVIDSFTHWSIVDKTCNVFIKPSYIFTELTFNSFTVCIIYHVINHKGNYLPWIDKADKLISMLSNVNPTLKFKSEMYELTFFDLVIYKGEIF